MIHLSGFIGFPSPSFVPSGSVPDVFFRLKSEVGFLMCVWGGGRFAVGLYVGLLLIWSWWVRVCIIRM